MSGVIGVDFAQYTPVPSQADLRYIRDAHGVQYVGIGAGDLNRARRDAQMAAVAESGLRLEAWPYLQWGRAEQQTEDAIRAVAPYPVERLWLDVEDVDSIWREPTLQGRIATVRRCVELVQAAGYLTGIYTGRWYWMPHMGNTAAFGDVPLWTAYYNRDNQGNWIVGLPIDDSRYQPYGGWPSLHTRQYRGTYALPLAEPGRTLNVDMNWRSDLTWELEGSNDLATPQALVEAFRALTREQLGEIEQIIGAGVLSIAGLPDDDETLYLDEGTKYANEGETTRSLFDHWLKDRALEGGGSASGGHGDGSHTHD